MLHKLSLIKFSLLRSVEIAMLFFWTMNFTANLVCKIPRYTLLVLEDILSGENSFTDLIVLPIGVFSSTVTHCNFQHTFAIR